MQSKSYGRVLAKPKVLVNDNESGIIRTTDNKTALLEVWVMPGFEADVRRILKSLNESFDFSEVTKQWNHFLPMKPKPNLATC